jgi:hypothetical protein
LTRDFHVEIVCIDHAKAWQDLNRWADYDRKNKYLVSYSDRLTEAGAYERRYTHPVAIERRASPMKVNRLTILWLCPILVLLGLQSVHANGGHVHLGGIFFLLLGGLIFIGGLGTIFYLLFRADPGDADDIDGEEGDNE